MSPDSQHDDLEDATHPIMPERAYYTPQDSSA